MEELPKRRVEERGGVGEALGVQGGEGLGQDLGEDEDDQGQDTRGRGDCPFTADAQGDDGRQRRGQDVDEVVAEQDQAIRRSGRSNSARASTAPL